MIKTFYYSLMLIMCNISFLFSLSQSRLITTYDMPSDYSISIDYLNNSESLIDVKNNYDIEGGFAFSYEHALLQKKKFNIYLGSELMGGKKTDITIAFHSLYLMPVIAFNDKTSLMLRMGYSILNTDDDYMPENAFMLSLGSELKISDDWSLNFSNTWYETDDKENIFEICPTPITCYDETQFSMMEYNKFSISLVYELTKKETSRSSRRSRGRR